MPLIVSQEQLADGLRITCTDGTVYQITSADLPKTVQNGTAADCEIWANNKLATLTANRDFFAKVHVISVVPLVVWLEVSSSPIPDYAPGVYPWTLFG